MRILMSGANRGIGWEAVQILLAQQDCDLTVLARDPAAVPDLLRQKAKIVALDLSDLRACKAAAQKLSHEPAFDRLVFNAGIQAMPLRKTADGIEANFATNHLSHQILLLALATHLAPQARIVLTSSGTHDPAEKTPIPPPRHADAFLLADPDKDEGRDAKPSQAGRRAYSTSKLCNVMSARHLSVVLAPSRPDIAIAAFDPGFTPGTGLSRDYPPMLDFVFRKVLPLVVRGGRASTPKNSGRLLAQLVLGAQYQTSRGGYFAVRGSELIEKPPSELARNDQAAAKLWQDSITISGQLGAG